MNKYLTGIISILVLAMIVGLCAADVPDLVGNWTGPYVGYEDTVGFVEEGEGSFFLTITEQKDRVFAGYVLTTDEKGADIKKSIAGVIGPDNETLYFAEQNEGISTGFILGPDKLELIYLEVRDPIYAGIDYLYRVS